MYVCGLSVTRGQPLFIHQTVVTAAGDSCSFRAQVPSGYNSDHPPAILVGWHALGGSQHEIFAEAFDELCEDRGWIVASHMGPNDRHWNTRIPQLHCRAMLDWFAENYPFSLDSIYMCGGSMGAAAGQVWHNNNCAYDDYLIAATAGGSQILDCQLRQEQYLASGDTNFSMRVAFGGLPFESDSIAYEYHRYSAVFFEDTTESMHVNSLSIPVWSNWGAQEFEWNAYGFAAQDYAYLRRFGAETVIGAASFDGHGFSVLPQSDVIEWFSQHCANRFPDTLSLAADNDGRYFYSDVVRGDQPYAFARWDIRKDSERKRLDIVLLRNVAELTVHFVFPWTTLDTLHCSWSLADSLSESAIVRLSNLPHPRIVRVNGTPTYYVSDFGDVTFELTGHSEMVLTFTADIRPMPIPVPASLRIAGAYPNPFNSRITFEIESPAAMTAKIELSNVLGGRSKSSSIQLTPGIQHVSVDADGLATGIYFARVNDSAPVKVVLIR